MTKRLWVLSLIILALFVFWKKEEKSFTTSEDLNKQVTPPTLDSKKQSAKLSKNEVTEFEKDKKFFEGKTVNTPSEHWEKDLIKSLKHQGGELVKDIMVIKEKSLVFKRDRNNLAAHAVKIEMLNQKDESSSFRAIIDASTGKILETFDQTQVDFYSHQNVPTFDLEGKAFQ